MKRVSKKNKELFEHLSKVAETKISNKEPKIKYDMETHKFEKVELEEKCPKCGELGFRSYYLDGSVRCGECDEITPFKEWYK